MSNLFKHFFVLRAVLSNIVSKGSARNPLAYAFFTGASFCCWVPHTHSEIMFRSTCWASAKTKWNGGEVQPRLERCEKAYCRVAAGGTKLKSNSLSITLGTTAPRVLWPSNGVCERIRLFYEFSVEIKAKCKSKGYVHSIWWMERSIKNTL